MRLTILAENTAADPGLRAVHGLSVFAETENGSILFDMGPDDTFLRNAGVMGVDISAADAAVVSHGHYDHGGGLRHFLRANDRAKVYIRRDAFEPHYSRHADGMKYIGLDPSLADDPRVVLTDGGLRIGEGAVLFTAKSTEKWFSDANDVLFGSDGPDRFGHEQSLILREGDKAVLLCGCGHCGIVNILESAPVVPTACIGGFHLVRPSAGITAKESILHGTAQALAQYSGTRFFTCHCTGPAACAYLSARVPDLQTVRCGDVIRI